MRTLAIALAGLLIASCSAASAAAPTPTTTAMPDAPLMVSEGGVLRPVDNGARLPLPSGYAIVKLTPGPQSMDPDLDVTIFDSAGTPAGVDVSAEFESLDMDHGIERVQARKTGSSYRMRLSFAMPGTWRVVIHVARGTSEEKLVLVLPWVGL